MREAIREPLVKSTTRQINKTAHGFSLLAPVYFNGTTWVLAYANNVSQSNVTGIVTRIIDANRFEITTEGYFKLTTTSGSLVANTVLYLTATGTAGAVPTTTGYVKKALIIGESSSSGFVNIEESVVITPSRFYVGTSSTAPGFYSTLTAALAAATAGTTIVVVSGYSISAAETVSISDINIEFEPNVKITQTAAQKGLIITGSNVTVQNAGYIFSGAGTVASFIEISGDDVVLDATRVTLNNAGTTVTDGFVFTSTSERCYINGSVKTTAGTISNVVSDLGTDNDYTIRG